MKITLSSLSEDKNTDIIGNQCNNMEANNIIIM